MPQRIRAIRARCVDRDDVRARRQPTWNPMRGVERLQLDLHIQHARDRIDVEVDPKPEVVLAVFLGDLKRWVIVGFVARDAIDFWDAGSDMVRVIPILICGFLTEGTPPGH